MGKSVKSIVDHSGTDAIAVNVECHITNGLPSVIIIGYASKAVDEAKERLRASFANSGLAFPKKRVTINLSPADIPKDSTSLDLAMAVAILSQSKQIELKHPETMFLGELSLDGELNPVRGLIGRILGAKKRGYHTFYIPYENLEQAMLIPSINLKPARNLRDVYLDLDGSVPIKITATKNGRLPKKVPAAAEVIDLSEIAGQPIAKRVLEIAAAGHHNLLLHGPPGTGKTMLAKAMCGILPDLDHEEVLEVTHLHSLGNNSAGEIVTVRPFRAPHHTASTISLIGGGSTPKPGETTLSHHGVLFLDELPEFNRSALEALRQPLEDGKVTVSRIKDTATYPADFILIATQNPCPCGYWGTSKPCKCSAAAIDKYQRKVSGPIMDRIDLHLAVNDVAHRQLIGSGNRAAESAGIKKRVAETYALQKKRFGKPRFNSSMNNKELRELAMLSPTAKELLDSASTKLDVSARSYVRTIKVARTIADLAGDKEIKSNHISEALQYRYQPV